MSFDTESYIHTWESRVRRGGGGLGMCIGKGRAMVLCTFQCRGVLLILIKVGQETTMQ